MKNLVRFLRDESGATAIEYALILAAIGAAVVAAGPTVKDLISNKFAAAVTAAG